MKPPPRGLHCTPSQLAAWKAAAFEAGMSLEDWLVVAADAHVARSERERSLIAAPTKKERILAFARVGKPPAEIAALCGTTTNNVNSTISTARKNGVLPPLTPAERAENRSKAAISRNRKRQILRRMRWFSKC